MKKINNSNRCYCHRKIRTGKLNARKRTISLNHAESDSIDKYAKRLMTIYKYNIQLTI